MKKNDAVPLVNYKKAEITRFKGLGEISPDEFRQFIGESMRLEAVRMSQQTGIAELFILLHGQEHTRSAKVYHRQSQSGRADS